MLRTIVPVALAFAALSAAGDAAAQAGGDADARRLAIDQAQEARIANNRQRALDFAQRAGAISMTPSLREFIAEESAALGLVGEALRAATLCEREATANHAINNRDAILASCRAMMSSLRPRVGYVVLHAESPPPGLQIRVAGQPVNVILLDADYAVTPGDVAIEATGPGSSFATHVSVAAGAHTRVDVQLHPVEGQTVAVQASGEASPAPTSSGEPASAAPAGGNTTPVTVSGASDSRGILRPLSFAGLGIGAALVVGSVATLSYFYLGVVNHCTTSGTCETDQQAATASSLSMPLQAAGYGMLIGGGILAALGAVGLVMTGHQHAEVSPGSHARGVRVAPIVGSTFGIAFGAEF